MLSKKFPDRLTLHIGAICGPTFAIIDGDQLDHENACYNDILQGIPENILNVNQVIMICIPEQLRCHHPLCSSEQICNFKTINLETIPENHLILRSWFPPFTYRAGEWKEASISVGGLMVAGKYLQQKSGDEASLWKFVFWPCDWRQDKGGWERFEVSAERELLRVRLYREDYRGPVKVYDRSREVLESYYLLEEKERIFERLRTRFLEKQEKGALHTFQQPSLNFDSGYRPDIAFIPDQAASKNEYENKFLAIPFIPVFVGELHYVVPIGEFSVEYFEEAVEPLLEESFLRGYRLHELFDYEDNITELLANIGVFRDFWEETAYFGSEPFIKKYPGGWTFLEDGSANTSSRINFMTIEPEYPRHPVCSNSVSGALAAAIVQNLLYSGEEQRVYKMKGWTRDMETTWIEHVFDQDTVDVQKGEDGLWEARAPAHMLGEYICTNHDLQFVRRGRGRW